jgi:bla regulator protein BlaR1
MNGMPVTGSVLMTWLVEVGLHQLWLSAVVAGVVWAVVRARRAWSAETRYWMWCAALVVIASLPVLMVLPRGIGSVHVPRALIGDSREAVMALATPPVKEGARSVAPPGSGQLAPTSTRSFLSVALASYALPVARGAVLVWFVCVLWRLASIARGHAVLRRWRRAAALVPADVLAPLLPRRAGVSAMSMEARAVGIEAQAVSIEVRESADVGSPMVVGVIRPCILLPARLRHELSPREMSLVLAHELAHIRRNDAVIAFVQRLIGALYLHNPFVHWVSKQIDRERECSCDDRVVSAEVAMGAEAGGEEYAESLISVARHVMGASPAPAGAIGAIGGPTQLAHRIERVLTEPADASRAKASWLAVGFVTSAVAAVTAFVAPGIPLARAAQPPQSTVPALNAAPAAAGASAAAVPATVADAPGANAVASPAKGRGLVEAAQSGDYRSAQDLISADADVNFAAPGDGTALIVAAVRGDEKLARLLIDAGADVNQPVRGDGNPLVGAAQRGNLDVAKLLVAAGADVNAYVPSDETPLINAARSGRLEMVEFLVSQGAKVDLAVPAEPLPNSEIRSPLSEARKHGHRDVVRFLESRGATR